MRGRNEGCWAGFTRPTPPIFCFIPVIPREPVWLSQSLKALQNRHLTPAQGREKKKILGCWRGALPPANTPNPDFEKAIYAVSAVISKEPKSDKIGACLFMTIPALTVTSASMYSCRSPNTVPDPSPVRIAKARMCAAGSRACVWPNRKKAAWTRYPAISPIRLLWPGWKMTPRQWDA